VPYPISLDFAPDGYVLKSMLVVSVLTGLIFGLAPALLASRADLVGVIKGATGQSPGRRRWNPHGALVAAQVTISIILLICAGLFIRSLGNIRQIDPGFQTENLVTMMINPRLLAYDEGETTRRFFPELLRRVDAQPGVRVSSLVDEMPLQVSHLSRGPVVKEGEVDPPPNQGVMTGVNFVSPHYFDALRTPLVAGRDFTDRDVADAHPVVIVNEEFARRFYGGAQNTLGKRFRFAQSTPLMEIIGIARDGRYKSLVEAPQIHVFLPVYQHPRTSMTLIVSAESAGDLQGVVERVRREIAQLDSRLPVVGIMMAEDNLALTFWAPRVAAGMATTFGVLALVLATIGLYSVVTYSVSQRTHEIGIRMALGAQVRDVSRLIIGQGMRLVLIGIGLGLIGALALTQILTKVLIGVGAIDFVTFLGVVFLLVAVAFLACYIPARRAARVDPLVALRHE
jgi:putative ABC transport system permease protein